MIGTPGNDGRCLSFNLHGAPFERRELFDLTADPAAPNDLSFEGAELLRHMLRRLHRDYAHVPRHAPADSTLSDEQIRNLKAPG